MDLFNYSQQVGNISRLGLLIFERLTGHEDMFDDVLFGFVWICS
jgi:hypothetical protein